MRACHEYQQTCVLALGRDGFSGKNATVKPKSRRVWRGILIWAPIWAVIGALACTTAFVHP
jgi:hypothetical protein